MANFISCFFFSICVFLFQLAGSSDDPSNSNKAKHPPTDEADSGMVAGIVIGVVIVISIVIGSVS